MPSPSKWPPVNVKYRNGKYTWRPRIPADKQHLVETKSGHLSPPVFLGTDKDSQEVITRRYSQAVEQLNAILNPPDDNYGTLQWLYGQYSKSPDFAALGQETQTSYTERLDVLMRFPIKDVGSGKPGTVADLPVKVLTKPIIKHLHTKMLASYRKRGLKGENTVNGMIRQLSAMLTWGLEEYEYDEIGLAGNPCIGFRKKKKEAAKAKGRYVTDQEYDAQIEYCCVKGFEWIAIFFELAYLLASRGIEVRHLTIDDIKDAGIYVDRRKGSKDNLIEWSPRLKRAINAALALRQQRIDLDPSRAHHRAHHYLITGRNGQITRAALTSAMSRLKAVMIEDGLGHVYWTPHDLKKKGISDAEDSNIGGHKTKEMERHYSTKTETFKPPK